MKIRHTPVPGAKHMGITFRDHALAHELLDRLDGIELGAGAHNPFNLPRCRNVAPSRDFEFYKAEQIKVCGSYAEVDVFVEGHALPFEADSLDYVISSHVVEHIPDLIAALEEWVRVIKDGGCIFMIYPQRDALPGDRDLPVSTVTDILAAHERGDTVETWDYEARPVPGGKGGHYWRFVPETWEVLVGALNANGFRLDVVAVENPDFVGGACCGNVT